MHKYKVKQRYLNKLMAKFADNPSQAFMKPVNFMKIVMNFPALMGKNITC